MMLAIGPQERERHGVVTPEPNHVLLFQQLCSRLFKLLANLRQTCIRQDKVSTIRKEVHWRDVEKRMGSIAEHMTREPNRPRPKPRTRAISCGSIVRNPCNAILAVFIGWRDLKAVRFAW
jgi:hypothetical protein